LQELKTDAIKTAKYFRRRHPGYIKSVEIVALSIEPQSVVEDHMLKLTKELYARGLELHILRVFGANRKACVRAVLQEQFNGRSSGDDYEIMRHCLRGKSLAYSKLSTRFAENMAQCDHIDALKASMSRWRQQGPPAVEYF
jgi:hypothetical protein